MEKSKEFDPVVMMDKLRAIPLGEGAEQTYTEYLGEIPDHGITSLHKELCDTLDEVFDMHDFASDLLDADRQAKKSSVMSQMGSSPQRQEA